jgi:hypothetical protein
MKYRNALIAWMPLAVAVTGLCLLVYTTLHQNYRQSLNDPQIQLAEDAANGLSRGGGIENILWRETPLQVSTSSRSFIDIATSLSPWVAYYAPNGTPLESTGLLHGSLPAIPDGALTDAENGKGKDSPILGESRITWQPETGIRQAIVIVRVPDQSRGIGFVVAGRNMREVESREGRLSLMVGLAWLSILITTLILQIAAICLRE